MHIKLAKLIKQIANAKTCQNTKNTSCDDCIARLGLQLKKQMDHALGIHFVLPAFPAKSANRDKTLSKFPDLGEELALIRLQKLLDVINKQYIHGAKLTICSDGYVFNDIVKVEDEDVWHYKKKLVTLCRENHIKDIDFFDLYDAYGMRSLADLRKQLLEEYADDINLIKCQVKEHDDERNLFNGLHRFLYEDIKYLCSDKTKNQVRKLAYMKTYETIQRSHAWSNLVKNFFPNSIRLSIHPHPCTSGKLSFQLLPSKNKWATPWHNVVVKYRNKFELMKKSEAIRLGAKLISSKSMMHYYVME